MPHCRTACDARCRANHAAHVEVRVKLPKRCSRDRARILRMKACPCRLCAFCTNPPLTFAEWDHFMYGKPLRKGSRS